MCKSSLLTTFQIWKPKALRWLKRKGVSPDEGEDLTQQVWLNTENHLGGGNGVSAPDCFFWKVLRREFSKWIDRRRRFGEPTDTLPETVSDAHRPEDNARLDIEFYLELYFDVRPTESALLRLWLIKKKGDLNAAACEIALREGRGNVVEFLNRLRSLMDEARDNYTAVLIMAREIDAFEEKLYPIKRRFSAYLSRFAGWCRERGGFSGDCVSVPVKPVQGGGLSVTSLPH